jgi:hypothetical protein
VWLHSCRSRGHSPQPQPVVDDRFFFPRGANNRLHYINQRPYTVHNSCTLLFKCRWSIPENLYRNTQRPTTATTFQSKERRSPYTPILYIHPKTTSTKSSRIEENVRRLLLHIAIVATGPPRPRPRRPTNGRQRQHPNLTTLLALPITSIPPFPQHLPLALLPLPPKPTTPNLRPLPLRLRPQTPLHLNPNPKTARTHPHSNTRPPVPTHTPNRQTHTSLPLPGRGIRPHTPGHRPL